MRLRLLGNSGLRVSELCLGTMTFGEDWGWGADEATSRRIFTRFTDAGGNFVDTSNNYTDGSSERFVGDCVASERDSFVVATKFTLRMATGNSKDANLGGNSRKSMHRSVENSLRRLKTDYIDLLYLHMWDETTSVEEVLRGVDDLVRAGKVLYFAFSDTPAWVVSYALAKAEDFGWTRPVAIQVPYSLRNRAVERDVAPMARAHDLTLLSWGTLGAGVLTGKYSSEDDAPRRRSNVSEADVAVGDAVAAVARELGRSPAQVAINWVRQQPGNVVPILGCRSESQIEDNLGCLEFRLSDEQMATLANIAPFEMGFPYGFLHSDNVRDLVFGESYALLDDYRARR